MVGLSSFTGGSGNSNAKPSSADQKENIKAQVTAELAMANAQELIEKATHKCYAKCITSPGSSLSGKEETCLSRCLERYFEAFNIVSSTYIRRVATERGTGASQ